MRKADSLHIMEKKYNVKSTAICFFVMIALCLLLTACDSGQTVKREKLPSTDLSSVEVEGVSLGDSIHTVDLTQYTSLPEDSFKEEAGVYRFEEIQLKTDENQEIQKIIVSNNLENKTSIVSVQGENENLTPQKIVNWLGENHNDYWFDREQNIKAYTYYDNNKKFYVTFTFNTQNESLVWVILSR